MHIEVRRFAVGWLAACAIASFGSAYPPDFGPFPAGAKPPECRLAEWAIVGDEGPVVRGLMRTRFYGLPAARLRVQAIVADSDKLGIQVAITDLNGARIAGPITVTDPSIEARPPSIWCGDLNGDGQPDFIVPIGSGGNGLGGLAADVVVMLSSGSEYRTWVIPTMAPGREDFLSLPGERNCTIVKSSYVDNGEPADSPRRHSYWVYNLLAVTGDRIEPANARDPRFPLWIWWAGMSNHRPVRSLSPAEKLRLWDASREVLFRDAGR